MTITIIERDRSQVETDLKARASSMAQRAVGKQLTIRLAPQNRPSRAAVSTVTGNIVECEFGRFEYNLEKVTVVFRVVMECGPNKVRRETFIKNLPA